MKGVMILGALLVVVTCAGLVWLFVGQVARTVNNRWRRKDALEDWQHSVTVKDLDETREEFKRRAREQGTDS